MMESIGRSMKYLSLFLLFFTQSLFALNPGDVAPDFNLLNQDGKKVKLSDYKGKIVVLEWFNHGCPFVKKHYVSNNMQATQKTFAKNENVVWLSIVSSAKGNQGFLGSPAIAKAKLKELGSNANHLLLDPSGQVGQAYGAKTTPHMYIIGFDGKLAYVGAIDSIASSDTSDIKEAKNYALSAVSKLLLKEKPNPSKTKPYGCSVKY